MSPFKSEEFSQNINFGELSRLPCKFIKGKSTVSPAIVKAIAQNLKKTHKNIVPLFVQLVGENRYQAVANIQILDAAKQANLDFIWSIIVDRDMLERVLLEMGIVPQPEKVNILTATEEEISNGLETIKAEQKGFSKIKPKQVAQAIVKHRNGKSLKSLNFITTLKCGIGKAKISTISEYFYI
jgi:hypothetical protein